jgi:hypothetical protein
VDSADEPDSARVADGNDPDRPPADGGSDAAADGPADSGGCVDDNACTGGSSCIDGACTALPGLALHWKLDETSGTQAGDSSGNNLHGTYGGSSGMPASSSSVPILRFPDPASRSFVASNRHEVRLSPLPAILQKSNEVTLSAWFRGTQVTDVSGYANIVSVGDGYVLYVGRTQLGFIKRLVNRNYVFCTYATSAHLDGSWHHLAGETSTAGMRFYFDGNEACFTAQGGAITYTTSPLLLVGRDPDPMYGWYLDGHVDDVRVYTRVLSSAEIMKLAGGWR